MCRKIVITGATGIVGSEIYKLYKNIGDDIIPYDEENKDSADQILHLASRFTDSVDKIIESNILYMKEVIDFSIRNNIKEFVFFSGMRVYGEQNKENLAEYDKLANPGFYGISKLFGERMLESCEIKTLILRLPGILTRNSCTDFLSKCFDKLSKNKDIVITNPHKLFNNFILVDNIFDFLKDVRIIKKFDLINLAVEKEMTLLEVLEFIKSSINSTSKIIIDDKVQSFFNISIEKAKNEYNFRPYSVKSSLSKWCSSKGKERIKI